MGGSGVRQGGMWGTGGGEEASTHTIMISAFLCLANQVRVFDIHSSAPNKLQRRSSQEIAALKQSSPDPHQLSSPPSTSRTSAASPTASAHPLAARGQ